MPIDMVAIPPIWWPPDIFWHLHHVEFDVTFTSWKFMKLHENLFDYVLCGGHHMGFVPQPIEFGVKFKFLLNFFAITWKRLKYVLFGGHQMGKFVPQCVEFGFKFSFLLKVYVITWKMVKYIPFGGHQMCFDLLLHIELSPELIKYVLQPDKFPYPLIKT
jgi:hypothetical protein